MTNHIDVGSVLRQTLAANLYSNLVTRPTGRAVRSQIEHLIERSQRSLTVIDFTHVGMIDFSCADEVIAKLLMDQATDRESYFVFRGVTDDHWDAIESVVERHGLALVIEREGDVELVGVLAEGERRAFQAVKRRGRAEARELAVELGESESEMGNVLTGMWRKRLLMRQGSAYLVVGEIA